MVNQVLHSVIHSFINFFWPPGFKSVTLQQLKAWKLSILVSAAIGFWCEIPDFQKLKKTCGWFFFFEQYMLKLQKLLKFGSKSSSRNDLVVRVILNLYGKMFQGTNDLHLCFDKWGRKKSQKYN